MPTLSPQTTPFYGGGQVLNPADVFKTSGIPSSADVHRNLGSISIDNATASAWILASKSGGVATWEPFAGGTSILQDLDGNTGTAVPVGGKINVLGGTNMTTVGGSPTGDDLTINMDAAITLATSVTTPLLTAQAATNLLISASSGQGILMRLGDAAGATSIVFQNNVPATIGSIASDGEMTMEAYATGDTAAGLTISGNDIVAEGTDASISIAMTPKGAGVVQVLSGGVLVNAGNINNTHSNPGSLVRINTTNTDNTDGNSHAILTAETGGSSGGDPYTAYVISGGAIFVTGIDNSTVNDDYVISRGGALGTSNALTIDGVSGDVSVVTTLNAATLTTTTAAARLVLTGTGITGTGTDANIPITLTPKGTGEVDVVGGLAATGNVEAGNDLIAVAGDVIIQGAGNGVTVGGAQRVLSGAGDPNGAVSAAQGSFYMRTDGSSISTRAYINTNGTTGWTNLVTAT